jgi:hypothetical protein
MQVEQFIPNQYIAACWIVNCNVDLGYGWVDSNNNDQLDNGEYLVSPTTQQSQPGADGYYGTYNRATTLSYVSGCGFEHKGVSIGQEGPTANAKWQNVYKDWYGNYQKSGSPYLVYAWTEPQGHPNAGGHATRINSHQWQTNKNAS